MTWSHLPGVDLLVRGGLMMWPLAVAALVALFVIFERLWVYQKAAIRDSAALRDRLRQASAKGGAPALVELLGREKGALGRVLLVGAQAGDPARAEIAMAEEGRLTLMELERGLPVLDTVITLAPLLGLLGTITGMMGSFHLLSNSGVGHPKAVTGGIAEALIATATGLVIAVVTLLFHNFLQARLASIEAELELHGEQLLTLLRTEAATSRARAAGEG